MVVIDKMTVDIEADSDNFVKGINKSKTKLGELENSTKNTTSKMGDSFLKLGKILGGFFAIREIINFGKTLLGIGSDLEEITSKFNTVFKGLETEAQNAFNSLADNVGRSRLEMQKFGSDLGDVLKPLGFTTSEALQLSENITKLAVDVASFNNVSDTQAINSFRSALTGERESLKSLGIVISEADLKTEAYTAGIAKQGNELTKQQKALATYNLLLANTSDAQGDAVRTGGSFANQLKRLQGVIKDVLAESGRDIAQQSSVVLVALGNFVSEYGSKIIGVAIDTVKTLGGILVEAAKGFKGLFDILAGNTQKAGEDQITFTKIFLNSINFVLSGVKTLVAITKSVGNVVGGVFLAVKNTVQNIGRVIADVLVAIGAGITGIVTGDFAMMKKALSDIPKQLKNIGKVSLDLGEITIGEIGGNFKDLGDDLDKSFNDINKKSSKSNNNLVNDYSTTFDSLTGIADNYRNDTLDSIKEAGKATEDDIKRKREMMDAHDKHEEILAKRREEREKKRQESLKSQFEQGTEYIDKEIDKQNELIDNLQDAADKVKDIDDQISQLGTEKTNTVASRVIEIEAELKALKEKSAFEGDDALRQLELQKELEIARANTTEEAIKEAERVAGLNTTEKILEDIENERLKLEAKKTAIAEELGLEVGKEEQLSEVIATEKGIQEQILTNFNNLRIQLEELYTEKLGVEALKQQVIYDANIKKLEKIIALQRQAGYSSSVSGTEINKTSNNKNSDNGSSGNSGTNVNIYGDQNFNNGTDIDEFAEKVSWKTN